MAKIAIEPRQFAEIGTPNFAGATIIPRVEDTDDFPAEEYEHEVMEIEQITFEDSALVGAEEGDYGDDDYSYLPPDTKPSAGHSNTAKSVVTRQRQRDNESNDSSSINCDSFFVADDTKLDPFKGGSECGDLGHAFACRHCGKRYRWKSTMRRHERVECGGAAPSYGCPYCKYMAKQRGNLSVHMRKHHPDKPQLATSRKGSQVKRTI